MTFFQPESFADLIFERKEGQFNAILGIGTLTSIPPAIILSSSEQDELTRYEGRRYQEFITSRYFAKRSAQLITGKPFADMVIERGIFGQPVFSIKNDATFDVSISHKESIAGALVFPRTHPCAIDIESLRKNVSADVWKKVLSSSELTQFCESEDYITIFSAKEALSKILRCGMTTAFELFEISEFERDEQGGRGKFKNFTQYRFRTLYDAGYVLTIVYPRNSVLSLSVRS